MLPNVKDLKQLGVEFTGVHQGSKVLPKQLPPATAWTEHEDEVPGRTSPGENRRLLPESHLQAGVTLSVWAAKKQASFPLQKPLNTLPITTSKSWFHKKRDQLVSKLKPPYFLISMILVIVGVHIWSSDKLRGQMEWSPSEWWLEPWRLVSYGCVHASTAHLALNAFVAFAVGWRLEIEQGWWRVLVVWLGGVIAGALGAGIWQPRVHVVGASAGVYALLTAHLPNVCMRLKHIPLWWFRPLSVVVLGSSETCWALLPNPEVDPGHVAWSAHALGAFVGVPLAFIVFSGEYIRNRYIVGARLVSGALLVAGLSSAAVFYIRCSQYKDK